MYTNESNPMLSVIMPVYNGDKYVHSAIESVLGQSFSDYEFIIINDGSEDCTDEIVRQFLDTRIRYFCFSSNQGYVARLNYGISLARGKYIARMDADDYCLPDRFKLQISVFQDPTVAVCGTCYNIVSSSGSFIRLKRTYTTDFLLRFSLIFSNPICHPSVIYNTSAIRGLGGYDEGKAPAEDYDLWTRVPVGLKIVNVDRVLLEYRAHTGSVSHKFLIAQKDNAWRSGFDYFSKILPMAREVSYSFFIVGRDREFSLSEFQMIEQDLSSILTWGCGRCESKEELYLFQEEMSMQYLKLWSIRLRNVRILIKSLRLLIRTPLFNPHSICFVEHFSGQRKSQSFFELVFFSFVAIIRCPVRKYNYLPARVAVSGLLSIFQIRK